MSNIRFFSTITKLLSLGIDDDNPYYLNQKIRYSNLISVGFIAITFIMFIFFAFIRAKLIAFTFPFALLSSCILVLMGNAVGRDQIARIILSIIPLVLISIFHAFVLVKGETPNLTFYTLEVACILSPFALIDIRERNILAFISMINMLVILTKGWQNKFFDEHYFEETFGHVTNTFIHFLSFMPLIGIVIFLAYLAFEQRQHSLKIGKELKEKYSDIEEVRSQLKNYRKKVEHAAIVEQQQNWQTNGIAHFSDLLKDDEDFEKLSIDLVTEMVRYMNANQGGFFIFRDEEGEKYMELLACYAYERKKFLEKKVKLDVGLMAESYRTGKLIYKTNVPDGYVTITSGLGEATPGALVIVPLIFKGKVEGVFEMASYSKFETHELEFLTRIGQNIAATIRNKRLNEHSKELLQETRSYSEVMKRKEKEMEENLKELNLMEEKFNQKESAYKQEVEDLKLKVLQLTRELKEIDTEMHGEEI